MQTQGYQVIYSAALEREIVKAQQRPAPGPLQPRATRDVTHQHRQTVARFFQQFPQSWTVGEVSQLTRLPNYAVYNAFRFFMTQGQLHTAHQGRGHRGKPQRYRWSD